MPIFATIGILLLLAVVFGPQWWVKHVLAKHGSDRPDLPGTGGELARHLLDEMKLTDVKVEVTDKGDHCAIFANDWVGLDAQRLCLDDDGLDFRLHAWQLKIVAGDDPRR